MSFTKGFNLLKYGSQVLESLPLENRSNARAVSAFTHIHYSHVASSGMWKWQAL